MIGKKFFQVIGFELTDVALGRFNSLHPAKVRRNNLKFTNDKRTNLCQLNYFTLTKTFDSQSFMASWIFREVSVNSSMANRCVTMPDFLSVKSISCPESLY